MVYVLVVTFKSIKDLCSKQIIKNLGISPRWIKWCFASAKQMILITSRELSFVEAMGDFLKVNTKEFITEVTLSKVNAVTVV